MGKLKRHPVGRQLVETLELPRDLFFGLGHLNGDRTGRDHRGKLQRDSGIHEGIHTASDQDLQTVSQRKKFKDCLLHE